MAQPSRIRSWNRSISSFFGNHIHKEQTNARSVFSFSVDHYRHHHFTSPRHPLELPVYDKVGTITSSFFRFSCIANGFETSTRSIILHTQE
jgi:hypothetical protein